MPAAITSGWVGGGDAEVVQAAIAQAADPTVHGERLTASPCVLDNIAVTDLIDLRDYVELTQAVDCFFATQRLQDCSVAHGDIHERTQPLTYLSHLLLFQGGAYAAAAVVTYDHHVLDLEHRDLNCSADMQLRSLWTTTFATLRRTNSSTGSRPTMSLAGTRESEQPIHRYSGACCWDSVSKKLGSVSVMRSDQRIVDEQPLKDSCHASISQ